MKRLFLVLGTAVVILPWLGGARAKADAIQWTASASMLGPNAGNGTAFINAQNGVDSSIQIVPGNATNGTNSGNIVAAQVSYEVSPWASQAATYSGQADDYSLRLSLRDAASDTSGSLTFSGNLSGTLAETVNITNTFLSPTTQTLKLGGDLYTVTIGPFVPSNLPGVEIPSGPVGSLSASISVQSAVNSAPEPSSLLLACLGLPSLGLSRWLRRRKGVARSV